MPIPSAEEFFGGAVTPELRAAYDALITDVEKLRKQYAEEITADRLEALQRPVSPQALAAIRERAIADADDLVTNVTTAQLNTIQQTIADGVASGLGPRDIARQLDVVTALDVNRARRYNKYVAYLEQSGLPDSEVQARAERFFQRELRKRKKTIAQTEARKGTSAAREAEAVASEAQYKAWITVGDERVSDMDEENEAAGWIPIDEDFPSGHGTPPSHPNCRCTVIYRRAAPTEGAQQRAEQRAENTRRAKENAEA